MDPVSIAAAAISIYKNASSIAVSLVTFVSDVKNVDENVVDLIREFEKFSLVLRNVEAQFSGLVVQDLEKYWPKEQNEQLCLAMGGILDDSRKTIQRVERAFEGVRSKRSNWATQTFRQMKLGLKKEEIAWLRAQTHSHCSALFIILSMFNMWAPPFVSHPRSGY